MASQFAYKNSLFLLSAILVIVGAGMSGGCSELSEQETKRVKEALRDTLVSTTESWDMKLTLMEKGNRILQLKGRHSTTISRSDTQMTRIRGPVHIQIFDSTGNVSTRVWSNRAIYYSRQSFIELFGDVRVNARKNRKLRTEYLRWSQQDEKVTSPRFVTITTPNDSIAGRGFTGSVDLSDYQIREVSGQVTVEQKQDTVR